MLAAGDFVVPRLNGLPYLEKPPLLYWANAASLRFFGETPWAARLPDAARRARHGAARGPRRRRMAPPRGTVRRHPPSRLADRLSDDPNEPDRRTPDVLLHGDAPRRAERRSTGASRGRPWRMAAACTGAAAAGAFLTKGLIAIALPGSILLVWCAGDRPPEAPGPARALSRARRLPRPRGPLVRPGRTPEPGLPAVLLRPRALPAFRDGLGETGGAALLLRAGVRRSASSPGSPFFGAALRRAWRRTDDGFFFLVWFAAVFVFFSPVAEQAAAVPLPGDSRRRGARAAPRPRARAGGIWIVQAALATALAAALLLHPATRAFVMEARLQGVVAPGAGAARRRVVGGGALRRQRPGTGPASLAGGWAAFLAGIVLGWPYAPAGPVRRGARLGRAGSGRAAAHSARRIQGLRQRRFVGAEDADPRRRLSGRARARVRDASGGARSRSSGAAIASGGSGRATDPFSLSSAFRISSR